MPDDSLNDLPELRRAAALSRVLEQALTITVGPVEGTDDSGEIWAVVGSQGLPESVRVGPNWLRGIGSEAFARAVTTAFAAASQRRAIAWSDALEESGLLRELENPPPVAAQANPVSLSPRLVRDPSALAAEVFDAVDAAGHLADATTQPAQGTGETAMGKLMLTVSAEGTVTCHADPGWVSRQSTGQLNAALGQILNAALADLRGAMAAGETGEPLRRLDGLQEEALALLKGDTHVG